MQKLSIVTSSSVPDTRTRPIAPMRQPRRPSVPVPLRNSAAASTRPRSQPQSSQASRSVPAYVHPKPFSVVNGFALLQTIGQGSMGKVKLARHTETGQMAAVKIIPRFPDDVMNKVARAYHKRKLARQQRQSASGPPPVAPSPITPPPIDLEYDAQRELRIVREAFTLHLLRHPNIVRLLDFVIAADHYYLVFEWVEGTQLLEHVQRRGRMPAWQARQALRQLMDTVAYCHDSSLVHRDLKIENIMVHVPPAPLPGPDGAQPATSLPQHQQSVKVTLLDFGLGNFYRRDRQLSTFCGSLYFAAPELLQARPYTGPEVDMWSIGVIAYVLLCGTVPFDDTNLATLHAKIKAGRVQYPAHLSAGSRDFLARLLCVDPRRRATMRDARQHPWLTRDEPASADSLMTGPVTSIGSSSSLLAHTLAPVPFVAATAKSFNLPPLSAHHGRGPTPDPRIVALLKRSPFHAASYDFPDAATATVSRVHPDGSVAANSYSFTQPTAPDLKHIVSIKSVTGCGFGGGFGFTVQEVDAVLRRAFATTDRQFREQHPVLALYALIESNLMAGGAENQHGAPVPCSLLTTAYADQTPSLMECEP